MGVPFVEETDDRFYIDESNIEDAGNGLFAKVKLKKGDFLEIIGVYVESKGVAEKCTKYANAYKFAARAEGTRHIIPLGYGGIINHTSEPERQNVAIDYYKHPPRNPAGSELIYRFLRDIEPGEELLGHYGEHWVGLMDWATDHIEKHKEVKDDWETFLEYDLYNLGLLIRKLDKE